MAAEILFVQHRPLERLFFALYGPGYGSAISFSFAFLPAAPDQIVGSLSLADAWSREGCFLFTGQPVVDQEVLANQVGSYLSDQKLPDARFLWLENPNEDRSQWQTRVLSLPGSAASTGVVSLACAVGMGQITLNIDPGAVVKLNAAENRFEIDNANDNATQVRVVLAGQNALSSAVHLSLANPDECGRLSFELKVGTQNQLETLDIGLRFFRDDPGDTNALLSQSYPIFDVRSNVRHLYAHIDPCQPYGPTRGYLGFSAPGGPPAGPIPSFYRTNMGFTVNLTPQPGARLLLTPNPQTKTPADGGEALYYFAPSGYFKVDVSGNNPPGGGAAFMCGFSGVEYFMLPPTSPAMLNFVPGRAAYAPGFVENGAKPAAGETDGAGALNRLATTSWCYLLGNDLVYYAQPDNSVFYQPSKNVPDFLLAMEIPAGHLPLFEIPGLDPEEGGYALPMAPYAGLQGDPQSPYTQYELQILSPQRRRIIYRLNSAGAEKPRMMARSFKAPLPPSQPASAAKRMKGATPQGLLATFSEDLQSWHSLVLAQDTAGKRLEWHDIGDPLKAALQTNQQFLVISDPAALAGHAVSSRLTASGWNFDLDADKWSLHKTMMIFKFYADKTVEELAEDTNLWTHPADFNVQAYAAQQQLKIFIEDAVAQHSGKEADRDFDYLVKNVLRDKQWNGVLVLNCPVPPGGLPPELEALAAGIDGSQFFAHHMGIETSPIYHRPGQDLQLGHSSIFGLIHYRNTAGSTTLADYAIQVEKLNVLLENSLVKNFSCALRLYINRLFQQTALLQTAEGEWNGGGLLLDGRSESHDGTPHYIFTSSDRVIYKMDSTVLDQVEITGARFSTQERDTSDISGVAKTRFALQGRLTFREHPDVDLFSFNQASFRDLGIAMEVDFLNPGAATYTFDAAHMTIDGSGARAHAGSLAAQFPVKLKGFRYAEPGKSPADLGYAPIQLKTNPFQTSFKGPLYGLELELNLGAMGALAGNKEFTTGMLAVWSPEPDTDGAGASTGESAWLGIKLPGMSEGKKEITLQGIIKLGIGKLELEKRGEMFILKFMDIGLHVLMLSFPPKGTTNIHIYGDPAGSGVLAWYGAYAKKKPTTMAPVRKP